MASGIDKQKVLTSPQLRFVGRIDEAMYGEFRDQLNAAPEEGPLVTAVTTLGGDPEIARAMADDVRLLMEAGRELLFLGKAAVYSAGVTFMAGFPVECRFLTRDTRLLVHERQLSRTIELSGPLKSCTAQLKAALHEIEHSIKIEGEGYRKLIDGSDISLDELRVKAPENWYISDEEALERGLIAGLI